MLLVQHLYLHIARLVVYKRIGVGESRLVRPAVSSESKNQGQISSQSPSGQSPKSKSIRPERVSMSQHRTHPRLMSPTVEKCFILTLLLIIYAKMTLYIDYWLIIGWQPKFFSLLLSCFDTLRLYARIVWSCPFLFSFDKKGYRCITVDKNTN